MLQTWGTDWTCSTRGNPGPEPLVTIPGSNCEMLGVSCFTEEEAEGQEGKALALDHKARIQEDKGLQLYPLDSIAFAPQDTKKDNDCQCPIMYLLLYRVEDIIIKTPVIIQQPLCTECNVAVLYKHHLIYSKIE